MPASTATLWDCGYIFVIARDKVFAHLRCGSYPFDFGIAKGYTPPVSYSQTKGNVPTVYSIKIKYHFVRNEGYSLDDEPTDNEPTV